MFIKFSFILIAISLCSCVDKSGTLKTEAMIPSNQESGYFTDFRDGNTYAWTKIGDQVWMGENLRLVLNDSSMIRLNSNKDNELHGQFYDWSTASGYETSIVDNNILIFDSLDYSNSTYIQGICPDNWHLPSEAEMDHFLNNMIDISGYEYNVTSLLKDSVSWEVKDSQLPFYDGYKFSATIDFTIFINEPSKAFCFDCAMNFDPDFVQSGFEYTNIFYPIKPIYANVRCLKDNSEAP